ncbi:MAG: hypothetical protein COS99_07945 [Candidatus Omnitrophica bacterium CG07_land_8_20_14_0_80_42_15]|uniref:ATP synthase F1 complex delta/epsilon subunit N-terminal domain-containing protein n=1 Tax=Candidatus Aquitaenariimonas noxiae TaxID=1974741 RepID=A0A2J0KQU9_9BACT|nr:MAG: hypothetical protein COS99_07945 [Candidatus Omnitrophica bacterium CG07_land_8_20_14_0_80_42_15]
MDKQFRLNILSRDKAVYEGDIVSLIAPSEWGYFGILADHAPLIAKIGSGKIILRNNSGKTQIFESKGKGFLEVLKNNVTILLSQ